MSDYAIMMEKALLWDASQPPLRKADDKAKADDDKGKEPERHHEQQQRTRS